TDWPVRRAGIEVLAVLKDAASLKLLLDAAVNRAEEAAVRGAALRALAERDAQETLELACHALRDPEAMLYEDAYAALKTIARTRRAEMQKATKHCAPRAANILKTVMSDE
ncbi:MAG: hypothetical protein H7Y30_13585, partial [Pyrinomonadaceae bacterium]|nr:hypothetical protein [Pyrinomonadaceae bacterium]